MIEFQNKKRLDRMIYSRYTIFVLFVIIIILANAVWNSYNKYQRSREASYKSKQELSTLEQRKNLLSKSVAILNTDDGKEREIRERFGLLKDGEKMVIFVDDADTSSNASLSQNHWWDWIVDLFR